MLKVKGEYTVAPPEIMLVAAIDQVSVIIGVVPRTPRPVGPRVNVG